MSKLILMPAALASLMALSTGSQFQVSLVGWMCCQKYWKRTQPAPVPFTSAASVAFRSQVLKPYGFGLSLLISVVLTVSVPVLLAENQRRRASHRSNISVRHWLTVCAPGYCGYRVGETSRSLQYDGIELDTSRYCPPQCGAVGSVAASPPSGPIR